MLGALASVLMPVASTCCLPKSRCLAKRKSLNLPVLYELEKQASQMQLEFDTEILMKECLVGSENSP